MLIPRSIFPCLRRPEKCLIPVFLCPAKKHSSSGCGNNFIPVKGKNAVISKKTAFNSFVLRTQRFCGIFNQNRIVLSADFRYFIQFCRSPVKMCQHNNFSIRILCKSFFKCFRTHVPCFFLRVDKNLNASFITHGIYRSRESQIRAKNIIPRSDTCKFYGKMYRRSSGNRCKSESISSEILRHFVFESVAVKTERCYPVAVKSLFYVVIFLSVHRRRCKQNSFHNHDSFLP